jgi:hypothetical protein
MNKDELTKILKPLIKECVKEVIMEEPGVLAHIIKESVQGVSVSTITEGRDEEPIRKFMKKAQKAKPKKDINETRKRLLDSIGGAGNFGGVNIFEGTEPLAAAPSSQQEKFGALRDSDPNDSGVDLSAFGL